ncbi:cupin domain containing protein [Nitzschia inconspicua]|uniref:Bifunctional lysine-specific demethylase and histidyl-hydroxylase n=1 Tax=Nitzschia inconspicua TaxID=303405 RepID=A0A9K3M2V1_9STRA|nr:cupin domain containing protein [Nitzschia inconspicua]
MGCRGSVQSRQCHTHHRPDTYYGVSILSLATVRRFATVSTNADELSSAESLPPPRRPDVITTQSTALAQQVLATMRDESASLGKQHAEQFGLDEGSSTTSATCAGLYALLYAMKKNLSLGLQGYPLVLRKDDLEQVLKAEDSEVTLFQNYFTMQDVEKAVEDDFLDAARGSTDNRKGWKITTVSNPRGDSFEQARMTYEDVLQAMEKGTVIFNAAGAHIPRLAGPCLAVSDATNTPNAVNLYITSAGKRTSAPPHTDKQDVIVVQTTGRKHWRVYSPPDPAFKPQADVFARGKGDDSLPLYTLESDESSSELLLETDLSPGDVLFVPAGFPHTTGTAYTDHASSGDETSVHLTFNIDTHVWDLNYLSARRLALRKANVLDTALGQSRDEDNPYIGKVNELPSNIHQELLSEFPLDFLKEEGNEIPQESTVEAISAELKRISKAVDLQTFEQVDDPIWKETVERLRQQGQELLEIHRDMYLAALKEGHTRQAEEAMTAHLNDNGSTSRRKTMSPERIQRLSLFRVQRYYEKINKAKADLLQWSYDIKAASKAEVAEGKKAALPDDWAFTMPVKVGDEVEADLGGAFFPATVRKVLPGNKFDVQFFDGDQESGLDRSMIKLMKPPNLGSEDDMATSSMTPKQLKRWKKAQKKNSK